MADTAAPSPPASQPVIRDITSSDVWAALSAGWADFRAAPRFGIFFGAVFSALGILIAAQMWVWESGYWVLPLMAGFPLIGPFAAVGLYEVSRRLETGEQLDWRAVIGVVYDQRHRQLPSMAFVVLFFLLVWVYLAHLVFALSFGLQPLTNVMTSPAVFLTPPGLLMLGSGTLVGGALAALLFAITVVGVPLLLERDLDVVTAMISSFEAVTHNLRPMILWGAIVTVLTVAAMIPLFLGMLVIFPVLGHATWHLYRKTVAGPEPLT
ncbi:MAG: DUF2189 domain-containing protein [Pseudomonadota bacterium]